jgi:uncharacterized protein (DUF2235 family)
MMPKNIIICCDGTGNDLHNPDTDSNVVKLYNTLHICPEQIAYYHPGVGTLGSPNVNGRLAKWWSQMRGLAFDAGLLDNVGDAYRYLMNTLSLHFWLAARATASAVSNRGSPCSDCLP